MAFSCSSPCCVPDASARGRLLLQPCADVTAEVQSNGCTHLCDVLHRYTLKLIYTYLPCKNRVAKGV